MSAEQRIKEIEEEIKKTQYNKATSHHIGKLKAKIAQLKERIEIRNSSGTKGQGFHVKKSGDSTAVLLGFPSVGKSTILNYLTNANSKVGAYQFTTLDIVPGIMEYEDAKIQILDIPGIITGASKGKGKGREILSAARNADLIIMVLDVFNPQHMDVILEEIRNIGIRPNQKKPDVKVTRQKTGGLTLITTVKLTKIDERTIQEILNEYGIHSAEVIIRDDVTIDQFIDAMEPNRAYIPMTVVVNKIDLADEEHLEKIKNKLPNALLVSADDGIRMDQLKENIFVDLDLIRIYLKPQGKKADMEEPLIIRNGSTIEDIARKLHRDFVKNFKYAKVWGKSVKFPGQKVGLDHEVMDRDVVRIIIKK
ncbi:MAG: GTP-binding protein [Methanobacteriaceae archaeon]|nr:GTP-binding protein [Methanobacteriaceae archaeon]